MLRTLRFQLYRYNSTRKYFLLFSISILSTGICIRFHHSFFFNIKSSQITYEMMEWKLIRVFPLFVLFMFSIHIPSHLMLVLCCRYSGNDALSRENKSILFDCFPFLLYHVLYVWLYFSGRYDQTNDIILWTNVCMHITHCSVTHSHSIFYQWYIAHCVQYIFFWNVPSICQKRWVSEWAFK